MSILSTRSVAVVGCAALLLLAGSGRARAAEPPARYQRLHVEGRRSAFASVAANGGFVAVAWGATDAGGLTDVFVAVSRDGALTFGPPVRASSVAHPASLSGEQPARVTLRRSQNTDPDIVVLWSSKSTRGVRLVTATSSDGGRTFAGERVVRGTEAPGTRGWASMALDSSGRILVSWLDHRDTAESAHTGMEHSGRREVRPKEDPAVRAQLSALWVSRLDDVSEPQILARGVCYCCKTSLVSVPSVPSGALHAAWRHVYQGNERDIGFTTSRDGGRTFSEPLRVHRDGWVIDGCPEDGPSLAAAPSGQVHIVWPTIQTIAGASKAAIFYASGDAKGGFSAPQAIPAAGVGRHPVLTATSNGFLVAAWDEGRDGRRAIACGRWRTGGDPASMAVGRFDLERGVYPALAALGAGAVIAWTGGPPEASYVAVARVGMPGGQP